MPIHTGHLFRIGVIADTHVPDRVDSLHPDVNTIFRQLKVQLILHAGDVSAPLVIGQLQTIADCIVVKGNRDWRSLSGLNPFEMIKINGVSIALMHGHGSLREYILDKFPYYLFGYQFNRYPKKLLKYSRDANVIVFGHTHQAENQWVDGRLFFNPGSAYEGKSPNSSATIGLLEIDESQHIKGSIIPMRKANWSKKGWILQ